MGWRGLTILVGAIGLCGKVEIAFGKTLNLVGPNLHYTAGPGDVQIRMMVFHLCYFSHPVRKRHGFDKVSEAILPLKMTG